ncbi:ChiA1_BD domain containing protein [uncultured Caudovirales phage]|uniref:ChiA1_BD domain containing protein n=1 Tax=uncultured Caudovirales phage TaxID=2100421 RepID=A0A6J5N8N2_9CAUD|nr:ChiA1_BD domain containing protein [uncultured Caudovirales phage]
MRLFLATWTASTAYAVADGVSHAGNNYYCITAHTSTSTFDPTKFRTLVPTDDYNSPLRNTIYSPNFFAVDIVYIALPNSSGTIDDTTILRLCTGGMDLDITEVGGVKTYLAQGDFMGFSTVTEEYEVRVGRFEISLSGLATGMAERFTGNIDFEGAKVQVAKVFLDYQTLQPMQNMPYLMFEGQVYNVKIVESSVTCAISVECATLWADFERTKGRKTNNESNWLFQAGTRTDLAFTKSSTVTQSQYKWGRL